MSREAAWEDVARALAIRSVLRDEASRRGSLTHGGDDLLPDDATIEALLDQAVTVPEADETTRRRGHAANRARFRIRELWKASHILIAAGPADAAAREEAERRARTLLSGVFANRSRFEALAEAHSACPSGKDGGGSGR